MRDQNKYEPLLTDASRSSCRVTAPRAVYNGRAVEEDERKGWVSLDLRICEPVGAGLANRIPLALI